MQMNYYNKRNIIEMTSIKKQSINEKMVDDIISEVSSYSLYSVLKTNECLNKKMIENLALFLLSANKVLTFGMGNSGIAAQFLTSSLNKIGINCFNPVSIHDLMIQKEYLKNNDVLIIFSTSLETKEIKFILQKLDSFKFKTCLVTEEKNKNKYPVDFTVCYSKHDLEVTSFPAISTLTSQIYSVNILFNVIMYKLSDTKIKKGNHDNFEWNKSI
ncbi:MurR/RpiR family transcriptional regulator [Spiroplasma clarkii]|uniref:MurR/RpiR family transcriptional regulator n=2 Tax=Spiroplasma clarkii TaxID=2139 RepID=A0A2K8KGH4_9MOLU|nr:MurR/RpiR family transcriptional regulator [Spiroplasma clarkii]